MNCPHRHAAQREVLNYFAGLRYIEKHATRKPSVTRTSCSCTGSSPGVVMDQGEAGRYRTMRVRVGQYLPPPPEEVSGLMFELLEWWNKAAQGSRRC